MICGDPTTFAIESHISQAFHRLSFRALGSFTVHLKGQEYGVHEAEATMLACSLDEVQRHIGNRDSHVATFGCENADLIAEAHRSARYAEYPRSTYFGMTREAFVESISWAKIDWTPYVDEAFDDGSHILQFDVDRQVRLIAFKSTPDGSYDPSTLVDLWMPTGEFYEILQRWHDDFVAEWTSLPKATD
jgi:hypothetical protein